MRVIGEHRDGILGVSCLGKFVVSTSFQEHVIIWKDGKRVGGFGVPSGVVCWMGAMSNDGTVAAGFGDCSVQLWKKGKQRPLAQLGGTEKFSAARSLAIAPPPRRKIAPRAPGT